MTDADAFRVKLEGEDVVLDLGSGVRAAPGAEPTVSLAHRIVLSPRTAQRLAFALDEALLRRAGPAGTPPAPRRGTTPINAPPDAAGEKAALLLRLVRELGVPYQHERSFRLSAQGLQAHRFLLTLDAKDIVGGARDRVLEICRRLHMPPRLQAAAEQDFGIAACLHFGFEAGADSLILKLYLERAIPPEEAARAAARAEGALQHLAFKWDVVRGGEIVTRYLCHPSLSLQGIQARLAHVYRDDAKGVSLQIARTVLELAAARTAAERLQYLEVEEDDNARRSFDLNLYDAGLQVRDILPALGRMREHFRVPPGQFQALYDQIRPDVLGHLAGGVHRDGRDFFNVYYGTTGLPRFAGPLGGA